MQIEITAPRPDVVRVRVGREHLPEDASWAVPPAARAPRGTLDVAESGTAAVIDSGALVVRVDHNSLAVTVMDRNGRDLLAGAAGQELGFDGAGFRVRLAMPDDEHYFGLGDKAGPLDRRDGRSRSGTPMPLPMAPRTDPLYKSIPFFIGADGEGRSFGFFLDNTWRTQFRFRQAPIRDTLVIERPTADRSTTTSCGGPDPKRGRGTVRLR